jgi:hypothetical protein
MSIVDVIEVLSLLRTLYELKEQVKVNKTEVRRLIEWAEKFDSILQKYADDSTLCTEDILQAVGSFKLTLEEIKAYITKYSSVSFWKRIENYGWAKSKALEIASLYDKLDRHMLFFGIVQGSDNESRRLDDVHFLEIAVDEIILELRALNIETSVHFEKLQHMFVEYNSELKAVLTSLQSQLPTREELTALRHDVTALSTCLNGGAIQAMSTQVKDLVRISDQRYMEVSHEHRLAGIKLDHIIDGGHDMAAKVDIAIQGGEGDYTIYELNTFRAVLSNLFYSYYLLYRTSNWCLHKARYNTARWSCCHR